MTTAARAVPAAPAPATPGPRPRIIKLATTATATANNNNVAAPVSAGRPHSGARDVDGERQRGLDHAATPPAHAETRDISDFSFLLAHAGAYPLLSRDDERALAETLRDLRVSASAKAAARERMILSNVRLVVAMTRDIAYLCHDAGLGAGDLAQEGMIGLMRAAEKYDPATGHRPPVHHLRDPVDRAGALHRAMADQGHAIRLPVYAYERRQRLLRARSQLLRTLGREPTLEELIVAEAAPTGASRRPHRRTGASGRGNVADNSDGTSRVKPHAPLSHEMALLLLAASERPVSLDALVFADDEAHAATDANAKRRGEMVADPKSALALDDTEMDADVRAILEIAHAALAAPAGATIRAQQKGERLWTVWVCRALRREEMTLEQLAQRLGITRERVRQIEVWANKRVRRALVAAGYPAPAAEDATEEEAAADDTLMTTRGG